MELDRAQTEAVLASAFGNLAGAPRAKRTSKGIAIKNLHVHYHPEHAATVSNPGGFTNTEPINGNNTELTHNNDTGLVHDNDTNRLAHNDDPPSNEVPVNADIDLLTYTWSLVCSLVKMMLFAMVTLVLFAAGLVAICLVLEWLLL